MKLNGVLLFDGKVLVEMVNFDKNLDKVVINYDDEDDDVY